jgi:hypothetical protein
MEGALICTGEMVIWTMHVCLTVAESMVSRPSGSFDAAGSLRRMPSHDGPDRQRLEEGTVGAQYLSVPSVCRLSLPAFLARKSKLVRMSCMVLWSLELSVCIEVSSKARESRYPSARPCAQCCCSPFLYMVSS